MYLKPFVFRQEDASELHRQYRAGIPNIDEVALGRILGVGEPDPDGDLIEPYYLVSYSQGDVCHGYIIWMN